jgi:hypothetical protein
MTAAVQDRPTAAPAPPVPARAAVGPVPGSIAPQPGSGAAPRVTLATRLRAWLRLAYTDVASKERQVLVEWIIWAVIVSVVITVLQHDEALDAQYHSLFRVLEGLIFVAFASDYALNLTYATSKRGYALSFSGIIDLMAILPSVLILWDLSAIKFIRGLRFLRFVRVLQVVRAVETRQSQVEGEENQSLILDLQLTVIGISALLLLVPDDSVRNLMLLCTLAVAITTGLRRWLVFKQHPTVSVLVLLSTIVAAVFYANSLDVAGQSDHAVWLLVATVLIALVTWFQIESPAGGL